MKSFFYLPLLGHIVRVRTLAALCFLTGFAVTGFVQPAGPPDFYAVQLEGEGTSTRRRLVRVSGTTGATEIVSGIVSIEGELNPTHPLFSLSILSWLGEGPATFRDRDGNLYSFETPIGEPRFLGTPSSRASFWLFSVNDQLHYFTNERPGIERVDLTKGPLPVEISRLTNLTTFDEETFTIINAVDDNGILLRRQSLVDDSYQNLAFWQENRFGGADLVLPYGENTMLVRVSYPIGNGEDRREITEFWRWYYFEGRVELQNQFSFDPNTPNENPYEDLLNDVIGFTGTHYVVPPPTSEFGRNDPYLPLIDRNTLEVVGAIPTLFAWDSHTLGRVFYSAPSLVELEPGKVFTALLAREFSKDYSTSQDTVLFIKQADGPTYNNKGTGPDLPPFVGLSVNTFDPNPVTIHYFGSDAVIEIDTATGNRRVVTEVPDDRFVIGSGIPVASR